MSILALINISCVKEVDTTFKVPEDYPNMDLLSTLIFNVPMQANKVTRITSNGNVIAETAIPMSIYVAKSEKDNIVIDYINNISPNKEWGTAQMWQTVAFEDSPDGDHDYNDLIIHPKYELKVENGSKVFKIGIHPIALGAKKSIKLGFLIYQGNNLIVNQLATPNGDCRSEIFQMTSDESQTPFINTCAENNPNGVYRKYDTFTKTFKYNVTTNSIASLSVVWYIVVNHQVYFAVNDRFKNIDSFGYPYGIIFTNSGTGYYQEDSGMVGYNWYLYPYEYHNIDTVYYNINKWLNGKSKTFDYSVNKNNAYKNYIELYSVYGENRNIK